MMKNKDFTRASKQFRESLKFPDIIHKKPILIQVRTVYTVLYLRISVVGLFQK